MNKKNLIFLSLSNINPSNIDSNGIYTSLLNKFIENDFDVYILNPIEKRLYNGQSEKLIKIDGVNYLNVLIGNITKTNKLEKGISTIDIEKKYIKAIKKYLSNIKFDLIIYPTPPITFYKVIKYLKKRDKSMAYLMLKDIFPQNAVDLGFFSKRSPIYMYFRNKEKKLYEISDYIGCMSKANVEYLLKNNSKIDKHKVEILPNSIDPVDISIDVKERTYVRNEYSLPLDKKIFIYGGNLGKPQGLEYLLQCIYSVRDIDDILFLIIGNGTEFNYILNTKSKFSLNNLIIMERVEKEEFERLVAASDIGLISLDYRFTIPNYPSRILTYLQAKLPILAITDTSTDIGLDIVSNDVGWWINNNNLKEFKETIYKILEELNEEKVDKKKINSYKFLENSFDVYYSYKKIVEKFN